MNSSNRELNTPVVLITGASAGIGMAAVQRLHARGWRVVLAARRLERLQELQMRLDPTQTTMVCVQADITQEADRAALVEAAIAHFGQIDVLVNNAGYGQRGPLERIQISDIRANYETNVFALLALTQRVLPHFRRQGFGRIINIGSVAGRIARPLTSVYDSTKHALEALNDGLREELRPFGFPVVLIRPGFILTDFVDAANRVSEPVMTDLGPYASYYDGHREKSAKLRSVAGQPDDIARLIEIAATARYPKTHYAAPFHAKVFLFLRWLLPARVFNRAIRMKSARPQA